MGDKANIALHWAAIGFGAVAIVTGAAAAVVSPDAAAYCKGIATASGLLAALAVDPNLVISRITGGIVPPPPILPKEAPDGKATSSKAQ